MEQPNDQPGGFDPSGETSETSPSDNFDDRQTGPAEDKTDSYLDDRELFSEYRETLRQRSGVRFDRYFLPSLLTTLAGADSALLYGKDWKPPYHNRWDVPYFMGSGAAILATGVLSGFSSTFFASFLFNGGLDPSAFWPVGVIVGLVILSIDRWLVSDPDVGVDYRPGRVWPLTFTWTLMKELVKLLPRLALTLVIGFLFAEPLLLQFFQQDIAAQMEENYNQQVAARSDGYLSAAVSLADSANNKLGILTSQREDVDPALRGQIKDQRDVITREQVDGNGNPRGGTCGPVCEAMLGVLGLYEAQLETEKSAFDAAHADELTHLHAQVDGTKDIRALTTSQVEALGKFDCPFPGTESSYPDAIPQGLSLAITCPESTSSVVERKIALDQLQDGERSYVTSRLAGHPEDAAAAATGVSTTIWLMRGTFILLDILPVMMKFIRGILPKSGYYLMLSARQAQVDTEASGMRYTAQQGLAASMEATRQAAVIERELRIMEYERMLKTVNESRIRLGLRRIEEFVQTLLGRHRKERAARGDGEPPIFDVGDLVPPPTSGPNRVKEPDPYIPYAGDADRDPRTMDGV